MVGLPTPGDLTTVNIEALLDAAFEGRRLVEQRVGPIPAADRVRLYMANPQLNTYGSGKHTG